MTSPSAAYGADDPEFDPACYGASWCAEPGCVWATGHESGRCQEHRRLVQSAPRSTDA